MGKIHNSLVDINKATSRLNLLIIKCFYYNFKIKSSYNPINNLVQRISNNV